MEKRHNHSNKQTKKKVTSIIGYRSISLISCLSKLLEKTIARRLVWFLKQQNLPSPNQMAFKQEQGALDSLLINRRKKTFDRIGIHTVIDQLIEWKLRYKIINFINKFLTNRKFQMRIRNNGKNGIPQGSPLSVVLFLIAFNKLNIITKEHKFFKHITYANDLFVYIFA